MGHWKLRVCAETNCFLHRAGSTDIIFLGSSLQHSTTRNQDPKHVTCVHLTGKALHCVDHPGGWEHNSIAEKLVKRRGKPFNGRHVFTMLGMYKTFVYRCHCICIPL